MTEADLLNALRDCYDPLQRRNIVDLRLVQSVVLTIDHHAPGASVRGAAPRFIVRVTLRAPGSDEVRNAQLKAQIENRLRGMPEISSSEVDMLPAFFPIVSSNAG